MARMTKTPGATDATAETEVDTSNVPTSDATTTETEAVQESGIAEQAGATDTAETEVATASNYLLKQILNNQARIEKKINSLIEAGGVEALVPKKQKWVQGKHGMELQDI